jgi:cation transport regulator ChaC
MFVFQVLMATGVCGSNIDYVTDLAAFLRANDFKDDHLFELEKILLEKLRTLEESLESSSSSEFDTDSI